MKPIYLILIAAVLTSCSKNEIMVLKDSGDPPAPGRVTPLSPSHNSLSATTQATDGKCKVDFSWSPSISTSYYELKIKSLFTGEILVVRTRQTSLGVDLTVNGSYSWSIVSKSDISPIQTESETYRFYNSGINTIHHSPFPATLKSPVSGEKISGNSLILIWEGMDVDDDIASYNLYFGKNNKPPLYQSKICGESIVLTDLKAGETYHWSVQSIDTQGYTAMSEVYSFIVL